MKPAVEITVAPLVTHAARDVQNWIIWAACLLAIVVYALLPVLGLPASETGPPAFMVPVLAVVAAWTAVATLLLRQWLLIRPARRGELDIREAAGAARFRTISIVNWALSESIGIYGLVVSLLGGSDGASLAFFAGSAVLLLIHAPRGTRFRRAPSVEELARGRGSVG